MEDCGRIINPLLVDEQVRGGIVQGMGGALYEHCTYSPEGQLLVGSMADYLVPMAAEMPDIEVGHVETPTRESLLGAKGAGEAGTAGAPAAVMNAINDALSLFGAKVFAQPFTPERILAALGKVPARWPERVPVRTGAQQAMFQNTDPDFQRRPNGRRVSSVAYSAAARASKLDQRGVVPLISSSRRRERAKRASGARPGPISPLRDRSFCDIDASAPLQRPDCRFPHALCHRAAIRLWRHARWFSKISGNWSWHG